MWHDRKPPIASSLSFPPVNSTPLQHPVPCTSPPNLVPTHPLYISLVTCLCLFIRHPAPMLTIISILLLQNPIFNPLCHSPNHIWNHRTENVPHAYQVLWVLHVRRDIKMAGKQGSMARFSSTFLEQGNRGSLQNHICNERQSVCPFFKGLLLCILSSLGIPISRTDAGLVGASNLHSLGEGLLLRKKSTICKYKIKLWKEPLHWAALEFKLHQLLVKSTLPIVVYLHIL